MLDDHVEVVRPRPLGRTIASNDPNTRVAQRPQLGDLAARIRRREDHQTERRDRQRLVDDVVQVLIAEGVAGRDENALLCLLYTSRCV